MTTVTAGLKCAPEMTARVWTSPNSRNVCTRPTTVKSVNTLGSGKTYSETTAVTKKTSNSVPTNSAIYAAGPRSCTAVTSGAEFMAVSAVLFAAVPEFLPARSGRLQHGLDERRRLARHPRARHDPLEAGLLGSPAYVLLHVRVEAKPRQPCLGRLLDPGIVLVCQVDDDDLSVVAWSDRLMPRRAQCALELRAEQQVGAEQRDPRHDHCARRRLNSWRTDSGRPHIWTTSTRPVRASRSASSPAMPSWSSSASVPRTVSGAAACPKLCAERRRQCQSCSEYGMALICTSRLAASM